MDWVSLMLGVTISARDYEFVMPPIRAGASSMRFENTGNFALYQQLADSGDDPNGMFRDFAPDFFDLVIVDECHRGSAKAESSWRAILEYFSPATQLGMTATPKRDETVDSYEYFGDPLFEYSLAQGIDDGFLAPIECAGLCSVTNPELRHHAQLSFSLHARTPAAPRRGATVARSLTAAHPPSNWVTVVADKR